LAFCQRTRGLRFARQRSLLVGFDLFGATGGYGHGGGQRGANQPQALLGRLQHQRHPMLALRANLALAQAVPVRDLTLGRQGQFNRHVIGLPLAALHLSEQQPPRAARHDIQVQHMLADVQRKSAIPGARVDQPRQ